MAEHQKSDRCRDDLCSGGLQEQFSPKKKVSTLPAGSSIIRLASSLPAAPLAPLTFLPLGKSCEGFIRKEQSIAKTNGKPMKRIAESLYGWKNALATLGVVVLFCSTTTFASFPPGFSSEIVQVKFKEGTDVHPPSAPLPPDLLTSVERITRLFTLSEDEID